jgi:LmbE family N-acetylglucosaminyl deacetylase
LSGRLAVVVAHPDDDTFGCAGTVALHAADPRFHFTLIHVTSGEAGEIADPAIATRENLGTVREEEDRRSWVALGREPDRHEFFRYRDGGVAEIPFDELVGRIAEVLQDERPDVVITFGPEGITGHPDHIATGRAASAAFHRVLEEPGPGSRRLLHDSLPASSMIEYNDLLVAMGREPIDLEHPQLFQPRGVPDETIGVDVDCGMVADRKAAALREHRTQASDMADLPEEIERRVLSRETHVVAWPERTAGTPVLTDVFEGLD